MDNEDTKKLASLIESQERKYDIGSKVKKDLISLNLNIIMVYPN